jgi:anti-anti-sigma regulatory factor
MAGCSFHRVVDGDRTVIRIAGVLDPAGASELGERLAGEAAREVVLDFSQVREFADLGVATLAQDLADLAAAARPLRLRGLRRHQLRIFRYFGLDVDSPRSPVARQER